MHVGWAVATATALVAIATATGGVKMQAGSLGEPPLGLDYYVAIPPDNLPTRAAVALGERLFFDPVLSADRSVACASCHRPENGFADVTPTSTGVYGRQTTRNAPSLFNAAYGKVFFWDGRVEELETQVLQPILAPTEMGMTLAGVVDVIGRELEYRTAFVETFGQEPDSDLLARALASYVRTLRSGDSPADRYAAGNPQVLEPDATAGFNLFRGKARCAECHMGPLLSDEGFHNTGVGWGGEDVGRAGLTGAAEDRGKFNTPSLRNVAGTAPYMHDGSVPTLEDVIFFYDAGANANPNLDPEIQPLNLSREEKRQLLAYLRALTGMVVK